MAFRRASPAINCSLKEGETAVWLLEASPLMMLMARAVGRPCWFYCSSSLGEAYLYWGLFCVLQFLIFISFFLGRRGDVFVLHCFLCCFVCFGIIYASNFLPYSLSSPLILLSLSLSDYLFTFLFYSIYLVCILLVYKCIQFYLFIHFTILAFPLYIFDTISLIIIVISEGGSAIV